MIFPVFYDTIQVLKKTVIMLSYQAQNYIHRGFKIFYIFRSVLDCKCNTSMKIKALKYRFINLTIAEWDLYEKTSFKSLLYYTVNISCKQPL